MEYKPEHKKWSLCSGISGNIRENGTAIKAENLYAKREINSDRKDYNYAANIRTNN